MENNLKCICGHEEISHTSYDCWACVGDLCNKFKLDTLSIIEQAYERNHK